MAVAIPSLGEEKGTLNEVCRFAWDTNLFLLTYLDNYSLKSQRSPQLVTDSVTAYNLEFFVIILESLIYFTTIVHAVG